MSDETIFYVEVHGKLEYSLFTLANLILAPFFLLSQLSIICVCIYICCQVVISSDVSLENLFSAQKTSTGISDDHRMLMDDLKISPDSVSSPFIYIFFLIPFLSLCVNMGARRNIQICMLFQPEHFVSIHMHKFGIFFHSCFC